jgi:2-phospho-L-lactate/phosphoenolpyruvate guanylyltransferase
MKGLWVIVPFKGKGKKSRLSPAVGPEERDELARAMLADVLRQLESSGLAPRAAVVSSDSVALRYAESVGAVVLRERGDRGVNAAVALGLRTLKGGGPFLVVPSDLPLLTLKDIKSVLRYHMEGFDVVLSPPRAFDGTNLFLFRRSGKVPLSYDGQSFWNHLSGAARRGMRVAVYTGEGAVTDVDSMEDLVRLARSRARRRSVALARRVLKG